MSYIKSKTHNIPANIRELFSKGEARYSIEEHHRKVSAKAALHYFLDCLSEFSDTNLDWDDKTTVYLTHPDFNYYAVVFAKSIDEGKSHSFTVSFAKKNEKGEFVKYSPRLIESELS